MAKAKMQKMRKMQKTQKMKKLRKMQKTRKMKGGFDFTSSLKNMASSGLSKASELGKQGLSKASELGESAYAQGKDAASSGLSKASELGKQGLSKASELGNKALSMASDVYKKGWAMALSAYEEGSAMFEKAKNKTVEKFLEKLNSALEKGEKRLKQFLEEMGLEQSDIDGAIEAISEGNIEALKNNKGLKKLMDEFKNDRLGFFKKAGDAEEELPEAQAVEVSADKVLAEVVDEVKDAEAEVVDAEAEVEDAEAEVEDAEKLGGGMMQNTIDDLFFLVCLVITDGPIEGVAQWRRYLEMVKTPEGRDKINKLYEEEKARAERDPRRGGGKRNKPVKSRKNRKSKKSKSAKKH